MDGYIVGELSRALRTATSHEDPAARSRADARAAAWSEVLEGMSSGRLQIGSRTPVRGLPDWATPMVMRGGFATGRFAAGGSLQPYEQEWADRFGLLPSRALLFAFFLTDAGLAELDRLLSERTYRAELPEETALLTVAWLLRTGDRPRAFELLDLLSPFAHLLRFTPRPATMPALPTGHLFVSTASQVEARLSTKPAQAAVEDQRETLAVWNPLSDEFLALWWRNQRARGAAGSAFPVGWSKSARSLVRRYDELARIHTRSAKHRNPKQNLAILVSATRAQLEGSLDDRLHGLLRTAVDAMVAKRGAPSSETLRRLRETQAAVASSPAHRRLAGVAAARLHTARGDEGVLDPSAYSQAVTVEESQATGVPAGEQLPRSVRALLQRAWAAPLSDLVAAGAVPSAEVLATLIPAVTSATVCETYPNADLGALMSTGYLAFRRRRSLLLLDLQRQVQFAELPWVRAVASYGQQRRPDDTLGVVRQIGALTLEAFPGTIVPNPLVRELNQLLSAAGLVVTLTEELAADIFMGRFSDKFLQSARVAGQLMAGSLYADYYDLDYDQLDHLEPGRRGRPRFPWLKPTRPRDGFAAVCLRRAGPPDRPWSVAHNGMVIEQAQLFTTHNLAALVQVGVRPSRPWSELAVAAYRRAEQLIALSMRQPKPLPTIKDAAYAWRQVLFFLSLAGDGTVAAFLQEARKTLGNDRSTTDRLQALLAGLEDVHRGERFDARGTSTNGRQLLGWTTHRHWLTGPPGPTEGGVNAAA